MSSEATRNGDSFIANFKVEFVNIDKHTHAVKFRNSSAMNYANIIQYTYIVIINFKPYDNFPSLFDLSQCIIISYLRPSLFSLPDHSCSLLLLALISRK